MTDLTILDEDAKTQILERYQANCHAIPKHRKKTLKIIAAFNRRALEYYKQEKAGVVLEEIDFWSILSTRKPRRKVTSTAGTTGINIKSAFREFMVIEQGGRCCYCQRWLVNIAHAKPVEHILPRSKFVQYTFNFWNLAVACYDCNLAKSNDVWMDPSKKGYEQYPEAETFYEMFHPRYHLFEEHVRYLRLQTNDCSVCIYVGITAQGRRLCRDLLKDISASEIVINSKPKVKAALDSIARYDSCGDSTIDIALEDFARAFSNISKEILG
jgi:uncharacterized protein (TIGR02646 family)